MQLPFFVYGTLKQGGPNYMRYLTGHTTSELAAYLEGAVMFTQGPYPFLTREPDLLPPAAVVYGSLISIRPPVYQLVLADLDRLEGYVAGASENLYERVRLDVMTANGPQQAWVYIAGTHALQLIRTGQMRSIPGGVWSTE
ncbi:gamma-glutamylcyclotransferase family protein [Candidatus Viridilinea mediisalina]|uniref:Gamma-glutamylcyclotransferase AIG2-like domain-containing protein n=1 Tax=Candidatus Viridilinea mediisalina TaxID=2024553 RepID=A0A2A6RPA2_9CHLR|nr:gamma-glutamylcyclotransferase family protein [Candidatus Viridilinea mediisalina]PDW04736.1 hypothetical protein CJ255_02250 [Candidatus Viridilinea mediisalina]